VSAHNAHASGEVSSAEQKPRRSQARDVLSGILTFLIRAIPFVAAYVAYKAAGTAAITSAHEQAIRDLGNILQWTVGLIAGIAAYTLIGEFTLHRLPRDLKDLEREITTLQTITSEQVKIASDLRGLELVYELDDALRRARKLQESATTSVLAMWALLPYDEDLQTYFADTLQKCPFTRRVIATSNVARADLVDHIQRCWEHLSAHRYEIYVIRHINYEAMVVDHKRGGLFFNSERGFGSGYISVNTEQFGHMVEGLIDGLIVHGERLPVSRGAELEIATVKKWLDNYY
jgi:hypothetical protein